MAEGAERLPAIGLAGALPASENLVWRRYSHGQALSETFREERSTIRLFGKRTPDSPIICG
jgi:hypothetical protein